MPRRDWTRIKAEYVEGIQDGDQTLWLSLDEVANRAGARPDGVRLRASKEGWTTERAAFQRRVEHQRQELRATEMARIGADLDIQALRLARSGLAVTAIRINELVNDAQQRTNGNPTIGPLDSLEMDRLARASGEWYALGTRALGEAPKFILEIEEPAQLTPTEERDARSLQLMAILIDNNLAPRELEQVIDVSSGRLRDVSGNGAGPDRGSPDPTDEQLHPELVDDEQPEPETNGLSAP